MTSDLRRAPLPEGENADDALRQVWLKLVPSVWQRNAAPSWARRACTLVDVRCASSRCARAGRARPRAERACPDCEYALCGDCACHAGPTHESAPGTCYCWFGNFGNRYCEVGCRGGV